MIEQTQRERERELCVCVRVCSLLRKTQEIIDYLKPKRWFIENPHFGSMKNYTDIESNVFDYCMFGFDYRKRTSIWSNLKLKDCMCDKSHLIDERHKMAAIGSYHKAQGKE